MLDSITAELKKTESILILPHVAADGDALGSSFALALALSGMGKNARVLLEEEIPYIYGFLPGKELSFVGAAGGRGFELAVALDCGDPERLGSRKETFDGAARTVNIDHHPTNTGFADLNYVDAGSSATGEIIYGLVERLGQKIDRGIAECLYVAVATDTGGFRYGNTTPETHRIAAALLEASIDVAAISQMVFDSTSSGKVRLTGAAIQSLELLENGRIAIMSVTSEMFADSGAAEEDCDGIINMARNIRGVEIAAMFRQTDNGDIKVNLRSNSNVDVSAIASRHSGGGHRKAAGFTAAGTLEGVKGIIVRELKEALLYGRDIKCS